MVFLDLLYRSLLLILKGRGDQLLFLLMLKGTIFKLSLLAPLFFNSAPELFETLISFRHIIVS